MQPGQQVQPTPQPAQQAPEASWQFHGEDAGGAPNDTPHEQQVDSGDVISWTASEYVAHDKSAGWYLILAVGAILFIGGMYLLTRDKIIVITLAVIALMFGVVAAKKPRVRNYAVDNVGVTVGSKLYPYRLFKSFSVVQESGIKSIYLMPIKRFNLPVTLYYPPDEEKTITETLGSQLPYEDRKQDAIDQLMHHIRF